MPGTIAPDQPISEAVRVLISQQLTELQAQEARYWAGERVEGVHRMRVALRRIRALLRLFGDSYTTRTVKDLTRHSRQAARKLGTMRDLDVFTAHLDGHHQALPDQAQHDMADLIRSSRKRRKRARRELEAYLQGPKFKALIALLTKFASTPDWGVRAPASPNTPQQVRHVLGGRLWQRYENVWAFGPHLEGASMETLHQLRIECKYLRYALEFFRPIFDEKRADRLTTLIVAMQDSIGQMHDASVASTMLGNTRSNPGRERYLAARQSETETLLAAFPPLWAKVDSIRFRRDLASLLANL